MRGFEQGFIGAIGGVGGGGHSSQKSLVSSGVGEELGGT